MSEEDLIYLLAGVLRELGVDTYQIQEATILQVLESQDQVRVWRGTGGSVFIQRRTGRVVDHEG